MEVFRICRDKYAKQLNTSGAANRWNLDNEFVLYASGARSLAALEMVVHRASIQPQVPYKVMVISIPDDPTYYHHVNLADHPRSWTSLDQYSFTQRAGSEWYRAQEKLVLKVPSAVIPMEHNYIINTRHPDFTSQVALLRSEDYFWDSRLM